MEKQINTLSILRSNNNTKNRSTLGALRRSFRRKQKKTVKNENAKQNIHLKEK